MARIKLRCAKVSLTSSQAWTDDELSLSERCLDVDEANDLVLPGAKDQSDLAVQGDRKYRESDVVDVLTDEDHTPGGLHDVGGLFSEALTETLQRGGRLYPTRPPPAPTGARTAIDLS